MYRSSPLRSTLNTGYITGLGMCKVCTEAVHCVALWTRVTLGLGMCPCQVCTEARDATKNAKKRVQKPKLVPAKRARKRVRGAFEGRRTSRFAGIYLYIIYWIILNIESPKSESVRNYMTFWNSLVTLQAFPELLAHLSCQAMYSKQTTTKR